MLMGCALSRRVTDGLASAGTGDGETYHVVLPWGHKNTVALSLDSSLAQSNCVMYTKLDNFLGFLDGLPAGSVLDHDAGCVVPISYQIGDQVIEVKTLREFCKQRGIKVRIYGSW